MSPLLFQVPNHFVKIMRVLDFKWAETSEGKGVADQKEEVTQAAGSIAFVAT